MSTRQLSVLAILLCVSAVFISGCIGSGSSVSSPPTLEETFSDYYYAYLGADEEKIWDLLSENAKSKESKDSIHNKLYALTSKFILTYGYNITNTEENGENATMDVDVKCFIQGYQRTRSLTVPFVSENGTWKVDKFTLLI